LEGAALERVEVAAEVACDRLRLMVGTRYLWYKQHMCAPKGTRACLCMCVCVCLCVCVRMHVPAFVFCTFVFVFAFVCVRVCVHV